MSMHPPHDPDELASDLVDGLLPVDEAARLRTDPAIAARVEAIQTLRAALRVAPPTAEGDVDRALAATFAALDHGSLPGSASGSGSGPASGERPPPPITHLHSAPPARAVPHRRSNGKPWLAAAAAIALLGVVTIGVLSSQGSDDGDRSADVAASAPDLNADAQAEAGGAGADAGDTQDESTSSDDAGSGDAPQATPPAVGSPGAGESTPGTTAPGSTAYAPTNLGTVSSAGELADRVRGDAGALTAAGDSGVLASPGDSDGSDPGRNQCPALTAAGDTDRGTSVYVADAVFKGNPVRVHLYDSGTGKLQLVATDASCADVVDTPYQP